MTHDTPSRPTQILICGTHLPTCVGLAVLLKREPWVGRCLLASQYGDAVEIARRNRPRLAIVDISDAVPLASSLTRALRAAGPTMQVVLTARCERHGLAPAAHGAQAFLPPDASGEQILKIVQAALLGRAASTPTEQVASPDKLTAREREVLLLISTGATNHEIAAEMHLSPESVKKHATGLYRKLGVRNRTEAAQRATSLLDAAH